MRDGRPVDLSKRLVDVLGYLASRPGEVIGKEALLNQFWDGVYVDESTLGRSIIRIRKAIDDDPADPLIQTVRGKGYRFVASST